MRGHTNYGRLFWLVTLFAGNCIRAANILCLMGAPAPSHHIWNRALMEGLADRGHNLTILSVEMEIPSKNMHYIYMENVYEALAAHLAAEDMYDLSRLSPMSTISEMYDFRNFVSHQLIATKGVRELLRYPRTFKFDAVLHDFTMAQVLLGFVAHFKYPPLVSVSPIGLPSHTAAVVGTRLPLADTPHFTATFSTPMGVVERWKNGFYHTVDWLYRRFIFMPNENDFAAELFGPRVPKLERLEQLSTLVLVNTDFTIDQVQPLAPNVIPVGGLQVKRMDFRDKAVEEFLDNGTKGVVLFSLGGYMESTILGKANVKLIMAAFAQLKEFRFIWKIDANSTDLKVPKNVLAVNWVAQNDVLAHKNVKLFITHGGLLSVQEAYWHAVPILGIPLFMDQHHNIARAVRDGGADEINIAQLSKEDLIKKIKKLINNPRYKQKMKYRSELFKNQPQHPLDRAIFWIEKAIKNNGLEYLRSPTLNMYFYEIHMLDIFFIIFIMAFGYIFIISYHIKAYIKMANRKKGNNNFDNNSVTSTAAVAAAAADAASSVGDDNGDDDEKNHHGNIDDGKARRRKGKKGE